MRMCHPTAIPKETMMVGMLLPARQSSLLDPRLHPISTWTRPPLQLPHTPAPTPAGPTHILDIVHFPIEHNRKPFNMM